jgi:hypothetical protein
VKGLTASVSVQGEYRADALHGEVFQPALEKFDWHTSQLLTAALAIKGDCLAREIERSHINWLLADERIAQQKTANDNPCERVEWGRSICHMSLPFMPCAACTYMPQ